MNTDFVTIQLTRKEAIDCFKGLITLRLIEEEVRAQKGFEPVDFSGITERLRLVLDVTEEQWQKISESISEDMWEYAWYAYTSEWAWFRAQQESKKAKKLGNKKNGTIANDVDLAERLYEEKFDNYVSEINMVNLNRPTSHVPRLNT
ncbi:hypothetical protein KKG46_03085 [Patescibacteria group bacterium]|nr:hypothetical protein [Patescibacteria group bacterium]